MLLPIYNGERYIDRCLASVCASTYSELEVCAIDDGSSDGTLAKLEAWAKRDRRIRVRSRANQGLPATKNELIDMADGEILAMQDVDDLSHKERFHVIAESFRADGWDLFHSRAFLINSSNEVRGSSYMLRPFTYMLESGHNQIVHGSVAVRKGAFDVVGAYREVRLAEDLELWMRFVERGLRIGYSPRPLYAYRIHPESVSAKHVQHQQDVARSLARKPSMIGFPGNVAHYYEMKQEVILQDRPLLPVFWSQPYWALRLLFIRTLTRFYARRYRDDTQGYDRLVWKT